MRSMATVEGYGRRHPRFPIAARLAFLGSTQRAFWHKILIMLELRTLFFEDLSVGMTWIYCEHKTA
jgi:hypothetical protein